MAKFILRNCFFYSAVLFFNLKALTCISQDSVLISIYFLKEDIATKKSIPIHYQIQNIGTRKFTIPQDLRFGITNDPFADFMVEIEKKEYKTFVPYSVEVDYSPVYRNPDSITLKKSDKITDNTDIGFFYRNLPTGCYRVRFLFRSSRYKRKNNTYSNWLEFKIEDLKT